MTQLNRRSLITGLVSLVAAPAIVRVSSIMPVKSILAPISPALGPPLFFPDVNTHIGIMLDGSASVFELTRKIGECDHNLRWRIYDKIVGRP